MKHLLRNEAKKIKLKINLTTAGEVSPGAAGPLDMLNFIQVTLVESDQLDIIEVTIRKIEKPAVTVGR